MFTKRKRAKSSSTLKHQKGKRQPAKESIKVEKKECLLQDPEVAIAEGKDVEVDEGVDE